MSRQIKSIRIQDFQNHQDTFFELKPGLNIITGSSDNGKSAISRSLHLAFLDSFRKYDVREGQKNAKVTIAYNNGDWYSRTKGDTNEIEYQREGQEKVKHSRFSKNIPTDVTEFLGHIPKTLSGALPLANQEEKFFLITLSDEALPKEISRLLGIDDLEEAASLLGSDVNKISGDIKKVVGEIESTKEKLEPYENLDQKIKNLNEFKEMIAEYEALEKEITKINDLCAEYQKIGKQYADCKAEKEKSETLFQFLSDSIPVLEKQFNEISDGLILNENIIKTREQFKITKEKYDIFYEIAEGTIGTLISECIEDHNMMDEIISLDSDLNEISLNIDSKNNAIQTQNEMIEDCDKNIKELEQYLKDNFEVCDVCGNVK
jgi:DNA repair exonuclease SbcCD ATPase subunit